MHKKRTNVRHVLAAVLLIGSALPGIVTVIVALPVDWWVAELLRHGRMHYIVLSVMMLLVLGITRRWYIDWLGWRGGWFVATLLSVGTLVANLVIVAPLWMPRNEQVTRPVTIVHINLDRQAPEHAGAFAFVRAQVPDIVSLQEVTPALDAQLAAELPGYALVAQRPLSNSQGSALLIRNGSGISVRSASFLALPWYAARPLLAARLEVKGRTFTVLSLHVIRPLNDADLGYQRIEFNAAAEWVRAQQAIGQDVLVIGDLNTSHWSRAFALLAEQGNLRDCTLGHGVAPTWPGALAPVGLPIDHCLVSAGLAVTARTTGPAFSGDHLPLAVTFGFLEGR